MNNNLDFKFQFNAQEIWRVMLEDIWNAKISIDFEQYIFSDSLVGKEFLSALSVKAAEGVRVRMLLDMYGSYSLYYDVQRLIQLKQRRVEIIFFNPIAKWRVDNFFHYFSRRDHRKLLIVDSKIVHMGSAGVSQEMSNWEEANLRLELRGMANPELLSSFVLSFNKLWQATLRGRFSSKVFNLPIGRDLNYITSTPRIGKRKVHQILTKAVRRAKKSVYLVTPYFVPTERLQFALFRALRRGLDVRLLIPKNSDSHFVDLATREYARSLLRRGAKVALVPLISHGKYCIIDENWALLGSANMDNLSLLNNYEHAIVGTNPDFVGPLTANFLEFASIANPLTPKPKTTSFKDKLLGIISRSIHRFL